MLLLTKLAALGIMVWFYFTAEKYNEPPFKWVVTGLIGYVIAWFLADVVFDSLLSTKAAKSGMLVFVVGQFPAFVGIAAAVFIRKKMISNLGLGKGD